MAALNIGKQVRVKPEIEELIEKLSEVLGYERYTIRNVAILYGIQLIVRGVKIPRNDIEFLRLLIETRKDLARYLRRKENAS